MSLNLYVVVVAIVIGVVTGTAARMMLRRTSVPAVVVALGACMLSFGANVVACVGALQLTGISGFTLLHVTYLWGTLALPLGAAIALLAGRKRLGMPMMATLCCVGLLAPLGLYMTYVEPFWLRVDRVHLGLELQGTSFTIGVLADLQTTGIGSYETDAIQELISLNPDVVLVPGDLYQLEPENWEAKAPEFTDAVEVLTQSVPLVVLVSGNTDTVPGLRQITAGTSAVVIDNETRDVNIAGNRVQIVGITLFGDEAEANRAIDEIPSTEHDMTILLAHKPDEVSRITETPVDLVVAGHTHGGQVNVPFFGPPITFSSVPRQVAAGGLHELHGSPIYVSTGVGRERGHAPQLRLGVRLSIGLIEVEPVS